MSSITTTAATLNNNFTPYSLVLLFILIPHLDKFTIFNRELNEKFNPMGVHSGVP